MGKVFHNIDWGQAVSQKQVIGSYLPASLFTFSVCIRGDYHAEIISFAKKTSHPDTEDAGFQVYRPGSL